MPIHVMRDLQRNSPDIYDEMQTHKKENIARGFGAFIKEGKQGDVLQADTIAPAMSGVHIVYYLVHSLSGGSNFSERDISAARNCASAAKQAGVARIIYLGGLGDPQSNLSQHLVSRHETGDALREAGVPVTEFRAAVIVGSGSLSFEMIRYLSDSE